MSTTGLWIVVLSVYLGLNFICALILHRHADRQAHLPVRFLDVLVHFLLLAAFAIPVLLVITAEALFGGEKGAKIPSPSDVSHASASAV